MAFSLLPIKERITLSVLAQLATIQTANTYTTEAGTTRHYQITVPSVNRVGITAPVAPADLLVILREGDDREPTPAENVVDGGAPFRHQRWFRPYVATIYVADNDPNTPFEQRKAVASSDLLACLMQNRQWIDATPVELADDTYPRGTTSFEAGDDMTGIDVNFEVLYTTQEDDPYSL